MDVPKGKSMFLVGHLRSQADALALGFAICALPKVETCPPEVHMGPARVTDDGAIKCEACGAILRDA